MTNKEAINWIINLVADIGEIQHRDLWHYEQALSEIREMLEEQLNQDEWIPCSERLPEKAGEYIVTSRWNEDCDFRIAVLYYGFSISEVWENDYRVFENGASFGELWGDELDNLEEVIAWMPLPKPWEGTDDETD